MENLPKPNSLNSMEGFQSAKKALKPEIESHPDASSSSNEDSGRAESLKGELEGKFDTKEDEGKAIERRRLIEEDKRSLERLCQWYFQDSETVDEARLARKSIEEAHDRLIKNRMPSKELDKFETEMVDKYANEKGEPVIKYPSLWARTKDWAYEQTVAKSNRKHDPNRSIWKPMKLSDKEGKVLR